MFSGIVEATGLVSDVSEGQTVRRVRVVVPEFAAELALGDSVAVDGACLTVAQLFADGFAVDVIGTTMERTVAGSYRAGRRVNVERALRLGSRLDGHLVQGHVDGVGYLKQDVKHGDFWLMDFSIPAPVHGETILHGSITLNGVSLTVSELLPESGVRIGVIPFTRAGTNLGDLRAGDPVNVEGDVIGKYVSRILAQRGRPDGPRDT